MKKILLILLCISINLMAFGQESFDLEAYYKEHRQNVIDNFQPIYAKILVPTKNGIQEEIVFKTDSAKIQKLATFTESYILSDVETVQINTACTKWIKRQADKNCYSSNPADCVVWCLVEMPINATETIEIFRQIDVIEAINKEKSNNIEIESDFIQNTIFPNPFANQITVQSNQIIENIIIFNSAGNRVFESIIGNTTENINLEHLPKGVYFVQIFTKANKETLKIIKL